MTGILDGLTPLIGWIFNQIVGALSIIVSNEYFLITIILCLVATVIGLILKFYKSFGLKRGKSRRR